MPVYQVRFPGYKGSNILNGSIKLSSDPVRYTSDHIRGNMIITDPFKISWSSFSNRVAHMDVVSNGAVLARIHADQQASGQTFAHIPVFTDKHLKPIHIEGFDAKNKLLFKTEPYFIEKEFIRPEALFAEPDDAEKFRFEAAIEQVMAGLQQNNVQSNVMPMCVSMNILAAPKDTTDLSFMFLNDPVFKWRKTPNIRCNRPITYHFQGHLPGEYYNMMGSRKRNSFMLKSVLTAWHAEGILNELTFDIPLNAVVKTDNGSFTEGLPTCGGYASHHKNPVHFV